MRQLKTKGSVFQVRGREPMRAARRGREQHTVGAERLLPGAKLPSCKHTSESPWA